MDSKKLIALLKQYPIAVAALGVSLIFALVLYFTMDTLAAREASYQDLMSEVDVMRQNDLNAIGLEDDVAKAQRMVADIERRLILEDAKASHYQYFLGLAEASRISIDDPVPGTFLNPGARGVNIETKEFAQMEYSLKVQGDFGQVLDFLYLLKTGDYFVRITRMKLAPPRQGERNDISAELLIRVLAPKRENPKEETK